MSGKAVPDPGCEPIPADIMSSESRVLSQFDEASRRGNSVKESDSNFALQIALKHMKERCQKQQARIQVLEEENKRLIQNKSELYGEIGKLQEHNIRLRERNLALNHEVHAKHQESCNMRDNISSLSRDHASCTSQLTGLQTDCENLKTRVSRLTEENRDLKRRSGGGGGGFLVGSAHASVQTEVAPSLPTSPLAHKRALDPALRAHSPLGRFTSWMGRKQSTTSKDTPSLEVPDVNQTPNLKEVEEKNGFLVIDVLDPNGNRAEGGGPGRPAKEDGSELQSCFLAAQERGAKLRDVMLLQRRQLKLCLESVRLVERNAGNKILRLDSANSSVKDSVREQDRDCSSVEVSNSDQQRLATQSNSSATLDMTYFTCPRCDCRPAEFRTEDKAVATADSLDDVAALPNDPLVTLICPAACPDPGPGKTVGRGGGREEPRVCPMCQAEFPPDCVSQADFESHVVKHFEGDAESLLGQFEDLGLSLTAGEGVTPVFDVRS